MEILVKPIRMFQNFGLRAWWKRNILEHMCFVHRQMIIVYFLGRTESKVTMEKKSEWPKGEYQLMFY
jgi:hypothetical protein